MPHKQNLSADIEIKKIVRILLRKWYYFVISISICLLFVAYINYSRPVKFLSQATVVINDHVVSAEDKENEMKVSMENQIQLMCAQNSFIKLVDSLNLQTSSYIKSNFRLKEVYNNSPIKIVLPSNLLERFPGKFITEIDYKNKKWDLVIKYYCGGYFPIETYRKTISTLNENIDTSWGVFKIVEGHYSYKDKKSYKMLFKSVSVISRVEELKSEITIELLKKETNLVQLSYSSEVPQKARTILNTLVDIYFSRIVTDKQEYYMHLVTYMDQKLDTVSSELVHIEQKVELFKQKNKLVNVDEQSSINVSRITNTKSKISQIESKKIMYLFLKDYTKNMNSYDLIPESSDISQVTRSLLRSYNEEIRNYNHLISSSNIENPVIINTNKSIKLFRSNIEKDIDIELKSISLELNKLQNIYNKDVLILENMPVLEKEYSQVSRQLSMIKDRYVSISSTKEKYELLATSTALSSMFINKAYTNSYRNSNKSKIFVIFAVFFGLFLSFFFIYLELFRSNKILLADVYEYETDLEIIAQMHNISFTNKLIPEVNVFYSEKIRLIRNELLRKIQNKLVMVTSSRSKEGKTFIACNLAESLVRVNKKVLLIDLNIYNPYLKDFFDLPINEGVIDYLNKSTNNINDYVQSKDKLNVLSLGSIQDSAADLLVSDSFTELLDQLKNQYDFIICDLPSIIDSSITRNLVTVADHVVCINQLGVVSHKDLLDLNELFINDKQKVSCVLTSTSKIN